MALIGSVLYVTVAVKVNVNTESNKKMRRKYTDNIISSILFQWRLNQGNSSEFRLEDVNV